MRQKFLIYESTITEWQLKEEAGEIASIPLIRETDDALDVFITVYSAALMSDTSAEAYTNLINRTIVIHDGYIDQESGKWITTSCKAHSVLSFFTAWWRKEGTGRERIG